MLSRLPIFLLLLIAFWVPKRISCEEENQDDYYENYSGEGRIISGFIWPDNSSSDLYLIWQAPARRRLSQTKGALAVTKTNDRLTLMNTTMMNIRKEGLPRHCKNN